MSTKRVVITGLGAITPLGNDINTIWENAKQGKNGVGSITRFDASAFKTRFACEVKDFDPLVYLTKQEIRRSDLFTQFGLYAATQAIEDAALPLETMDPFDVGVIWGSGQGGMTTFEDEVKGFVNNREVPRFSPYFIPKLITNITSGMISIKYGLRGINYTAVSACATSNTALMDAFNYIKWGKAKVIVTGGSEAPISAASIGGFGAMKALSTNNEAFEKACRPFDSQRDGFVMGEGGASLILEEYEHAKARGATIYAEVGGCGMTADAYHLTATHPEGIGAAKAMQLALEEANVSIDQLDYINTHATSTPVGDISEMKAIGSLVGAEKNEIAISATKSMTGHLLGAAGAIESIFCVKSIQENVVLPTINLEDVDERIPTNLNIVKKHTIEKTVNTTLSNTFGFGGHNASVVLKKI